MKTWILFAALAAGSLICVPAWTQSEPPGVVRGALPITLSERLYIRAEGAIIVRGESGISQISYVLRAQPGSALVRWNSRGGVASLTVTQLQRDSRPIELTVAVPSILRQVILETRGGNITASDLRNDVHVETVAGRIELDRLGSSLQLKTGGGEIRIGRVGGAVRCYSGGGGIRVESVGRESWFGTAGGDIAIREAGGPLHISSAGGNIQVDTASAEVFASTDGGAITIGHAAGLVTAETRGGSIQVNGSGGVRCLAGAGTIRVRNSGGGSFRASTAVGSILAELLSAVLHEDALLSTGAGDITVSIPSNIPVTVQARNETAGGARRIVSEFPQIRVRSGNPGASPLLAEGMLNGGGPVLHVVTASGAIYLRRQK